MMLPTNIRTPLKSRLSTALSPARIAWPNVEFSGARPYFEIQFITVGKTGGTLKGNEVDREDGIISVTLVQDHNTGEDLIDAFLALQTNLSEGTRFAITGGEVEILAPPDIRPSFVADKDHRTPCLIRYRAVST